MIIWGVDRCGDLCFKGAWRHWKKVHSEESKPWKDQKTNNSMAGFVYLGIVDTLDQIILCCWGCLVHWKILSSIPPCLASPIPLWQPKISLEVAKCCCGGKLPQLNITQRSMGCLALEHKLSWREIIDAFPAHEKSNGGGQYGFAFWGTCVCVWNAFLITDV